MGICVSTRSNEHMQPPVPSMRQSEKLKKDAVLVEEQVSRMMRAKSQGRALGKIMEAPMDDEELKSFKSPVFPKEKYVIDLLDEALKRHFLFDVIPDRDRLVLIDAMSKSTFEAGSVIIKQGEKGDFIYFVERGTGSYLVDGKKDGTFEKGVWFGELALLYDSPRAATCVAESQCILWKVDKKTFQLLVVSRRNDQNKNLIEILRKVSILSDLNQEVLLKVADDLSPVTYSAGKRIVAKGTVGEIFYIIQEGKVKVHDIGLGDSTYVDQQLTVGDYFGEGALATGGPRGANITAITDCTLLCLSRMEFENTLGNLENVLKNAERKRVIKSSPIFGEKNDLSPDELDILNGLFTERGYNKGTVIQQKGNQKAEFGFYIIESGKIVIVNDDGTVNNLTKGDNFQTIKSTVHEIADRTIMVEEDAKVVVLTEENITSVIKNTNRLGHDQRYKLKTNNKLKLHDFTKIQLLGKGAFGDVWMVNHNPTNEKYAMKECEKAEIIQKKHVKQMIREKNVMASMDHPLICGLIATFQDQRKIYMVEEMFLGGELMHVLQKKNGLGLSVSNARFYVSCVLSAVMHMHHLKIVYRDLKPENTLINNNGYAVLIDMGFAKVVYEKTYTMCGTPEYLAPEIILSQGYNSSVDIWALGIMLYELIAGYSPFIDEGIDQIGLFKAIVRNQFKFREPKFDIDTKNLISKLLRKKWHHRIGCQVGGEEQIKQHVFFDEVDFEKIYKMEIDEKMIPWMPIIKNDHDTKNFKKMDVSSNDAMFDLGKVAISKADNKLFEDF